MKITSYWLSPLLFSSAALLSGCFAGAPDFGALQFPAVWSVPDEARVEIVQNQALQNWWIQFDDPALNALVDLTLAQSPDRNIARARIEEARGLKRTTRSALFPQISGVGEAGLQDTGLNGVDDFYEAGFDASWEIDIFGRNLKRTSAANAAIEALENRFQDVTLTLIADVTRNYIEYRQFERQVTIALENLETQEQTLELIGAQVDVGEAPQLDVERAKSLVNTTRASIPEFERQAHNTRLRLSVLVGALPEDIKPLLSEKNVPIPGVSVRPVLTAPTAVLMTRPDILAAEANLRQNTKLAEAATRNLLPTFSIGGFFGVADSALVNSATIWNVAAGAAVALLDFGRIGQIDAARAREVQAYEVYRRTLLNAVSEVETALIDYSHINRQRISLKSALANAESALNLSKQLFTEGEVSFLDVLDAQRTVNQADASLVNANAAQAKSIVRLYKSLGVI